MSAQTPGPEGAIASPYVDIRVPLDGLMAGLQSAETRVADSTDRMNSSAAQAFRRTEESVDRVVGEEAEGRGHGFGGMRYQLHAVTSSMVLMGVEGNRAVEGLGLALSHIVSVGFSPLGIALAGVIGLTAALVGKQNEHADATAKATDEIKKQEEELTRLKDAEVALRAAREGVDPGVQKQVETVGEAKARLDAIEQAMSNVRDAIDEAETIGAKSGTGDDRAKYIEGEKEKLRLLQQEQIEASLAYATANARLQVEQKTNEVLADRKEGGGGALGPTADERREGDAMFKSIMAAREEDLAAENRYSDGVVAVRKSTAEALRKVDIDEARSSGDEHQAAIAEANAYFDRLADDARAYGLSTVEIEDARTRDLQAIDDKYFATEAEKDQAFWLRITEHAEENARRQSDAVRKATEDFTKDLRQADMTDIDRKIDEATHRYDALRAAATAAGVSVKDLDAAQAAWVEHLQEEKRASEEFWSGFVNGVGDAERSMDKIGNVGAGVAGDLKTGFEDAFVGLKDGAGGAEKAFIGMLDAIEARLQRFVADQAFNALFGKADGSGNLSGGLISALGNALGVSLTGSKDLPSPGTHGNLDEGAIATDAQMGLATGVEKSARVTPTVVNLTNKTGVEATAQTRSRRGPGGEELDIVLEKKMAAAVARGGAFTTALESAYGLSSTPRRR